MFIFSTNTPPEQKTWTLAITSDKSIYSRAYVNNPIEFIIYFKRPILSPETNSGLLDLEVTNKTRNYIYIGSD